MNDWYEQNGMETNFVIRGELMVGYVIFILYSSYPIRSFQ